jgi:hypothetical protein
MLTSMVMNVAPIDVIINATNSGITTNNIVYEA